MLSLNLEDIKSRFDEIVEIADSLPEKYQQAGFALLLSKLIDVTIMSHAPAPLPTDDITKKDFIIPIDARAFLQQYSVPEEKLNKLFLMEKEEVRSIYKLTTTVKREAQIQISLLLALENALKDIGFEFNYEEVRKKCQDFKVLDKANFSSIFKRNADLFENMEEKEHIKLSPDGKSELADFILEMLNNE